MTTRGPESKSSGVVTDADLANPEILFGKHLHLFDQETLKQEAEEMVAWARSVGITDPAEILEFVDAVCSPVHVIEERN